MTRFIVTLVLTCLSLAACSSEVTKEQYLDHAMKFSSAATTKAEQQRVRKLFDCMWPSLQKDTDLLEQFMAADHSDEGGPLSQQLSKLMAPCLGAVGSPTSTTTTISPATVTSTTTLPTR